MNLEVILVRIGRPHQDFVVGILAFPFPETVGKPDSVSRRVAAGRDAEDVRVAEELVF